MKSFEQYDKENPDIWVSFKSFTFEAIKKGYKNYSSKGIFELIRWHTAVNGNDGFKINNNYTPNYANKFMKQYPQYDGFFRTRK